jgi:hypothetical protein
VNGCGRPAAWPATVRAASKESRASTFERFIARPPFRESGTPKVQ